MSNFWDDAEVQKAATSGSYIKFTDEGDSKSGVIDNLSTRVFDANTATERTAIEISFVDGSILTAGQVKLMQVLVELRPAKGDLIEITLGRIEKRGNKTLKHWVVTHTNSDGESFTIDQTAEV